MADDNNYQDYADSYVVLNLDKSLKNYKNFLVRMRKVRRSVPNDEAIVHAGKEYGGHLNVRDLWMYEVMYGDKAIKGKTDYEIYEFAAYCVWADFVKDYTSYLNSRGSIEDFVSFREMINLNLYREALAFMMKLYETLNLQAGGEYEDKDEDFRRSPYKDKDTEDIRRYS
ncbi:hypothetical protein Tco_0524932 [Tanacetum coccineum]